MKWIKRAAIMQPFLFLVSGVNWFCDGNKKGPVRPFNKLLLLVLLFEFLKILIQLFLSEFLVFESTLHLL